MHWIKRFYWKAYEDNLTGLSGMVAYNLLLSILPLALLVLFVAGQIADSGKVQARMVHDLRHLFPSATEDTLNRALNRLRTNSTGLGVLALVSSVWFASSFWGALDTAICRVYGVAARPWLKQKRFALAMFGVVICFLAATVAVPTLQSVLVAGADGLPFGLRHVRALVYAGSLGIGVAVLFSILCLIYRTVPHCRSPWAAIWPGAIAATLAINAVDYLFPVYISHISTINHFGNTIAFVAITLIWFYAIAIIILGGGTVNAMRLNVLEAAGRVAPRARVGLPEDRLPEQKEVEGDDQARDGARGQVGDAPIGQVAHDRPAAGEEEQRNEGERDPE